MQWRDHIDQNSIIVCGKPKIKGTRITVAHILERPGNGWPVGDVLDSCPGLMPENIRAAQTYAATYLEVDETVFFHV